MAHRLPTWTALLAYIWSLGTLQLCDDDLLTGGSSCVLERLVRGVLHQGPGISYAFSPTVTLEGSLSLSS